jgi:hypothetical protein
MRKLLFSFLIVLVAGCKTAPPPPFEPTPAEIEKEVDAIQRVHNQLYPTNSLPPVPPPSIKKKSVVRAMSIPARPDKQITFSWDASIQPVFQYRLFVTSWPDSLISATIQTTEHDIELVSILKASSLPNGWYRIQVEAIGTTYLFSEPITGCFLFWHSSPE